MIRILWLWVWYDTRETTWWTNLYEQPDESGRQPDEQRDQKLDKQADATDICMIQKEKN